MTQRTLQLTQHGRSKVILLVALNSIYTFFSTFEKALKAVGKASAASSGISNRFIF